MMNNGMFTVDEAFKIAKGLHKVGKFNVSLRMRHPDPKQRYQGDEDRKAGRTVEIDVDLEYGKSLDELVKIRDEIRQLGYDAEAHDGGSSMTIMGMWSDK